MKKVYDPTEWVEDKVKDEEGWWFTNFKQDQFMLMMAFQLYQQYDEDEQTPELFDELLDECAGLLRTFYNHRYNPATRKPR